ncbi:MAG: cell envelope integrity protein TolA [Oligoflexia bacterium]|nr:cell envelope integrity protein TolA [Oligoflexia bacterium]
MKSKANDMFISFIKSLLSHILFLLGFYYLNTFLFTFTESFQKKHIDLLKSSIRVDMIAMPKMTLQELKEKDLSLNPLPVNNNEIAQQEKKAPTEKKEDPHENETKKDDKEKVVEELNKNIKIAEKEFNKKEKDKKNSAKKKNISIDELDRLIVSGNKLNKGNRTEKSDTELSEKDRILSILDTYGEKIGENVRSYWKLPVYLLNKNLKCRVRIYLSRTGNLLKFDIFESSGNKEFDQKAIDAIKNATPFQNPPAEIIDNIRLGELILGFPL